MGESPGPQDIATGEPFTGPAGDLLKRILASIGLRHTDCWLTNVVKFVSQGDEITKDVIEFFTPYLLREIEAVDPEIVIAIGSTPAKALLNTKKPISQIRGQMQEVERSNGDANIQPGLSASRRVKEKGSVGRYETGAGISGQIDQVRNGKIRICPRKTRKNAKKKMIIFAAFACLAGKIFLYEECGNHCHRIGAFDAGKDGYEQSLVYRTA